MAASVAQMLTANRLLDGEVVYWRQGQWVAQLADAEVFDEPAAGDAALAAAQAFVRDNKVVATYLFDVRRTAKAIEPVKEREVIRAMGPSVRTDLGKQAGAGPQAPQETALQEPRKTEPLHV